MLVIQIRKVQIKKDYLVFLYLKKGEVSKKDFLFQNQKQNIKNKKMLGGSESHMADVLSTICRCVYEHENTETLVDPKVSG